MKTCTLSIQEKITCKQCGRQIRRPLGSSSICPNGHPIPAADPVPVGLIWIGRQLSETQIEAFKASWASLHS